MWPSRSSRQRGTTRMPVLIASTEPASTACSIEVSAPSGLTSAQAKGWSSGWRSCGSNTHAHVVTTPPGPDLDHLGELLGRSPGRTRWAARSPGPGCP